MKILAICARIPAFNKSGDQVLSYHRLTYLSKNNSIQVICFSKGQDVDAEKKDLERFGIKVHVVNWHFYEALWFVFLAIFDRKTPFQCAFFRSYFFQHIYLRLANEFSPDIIYAATIRSLGNALPLNKPLFIDLIDSMGLNFSRRINSSFFLKKWLLKMEVKRVSRYERLVSKSAKVSFLVSELDRKYMGVDAVKVLPLGIDLNHFRKFPYAEKLPVVIFSGNMFYQPNIEAIVWFVKNCWSQIKISIPEARLVIAGGNPAAEVLALSSYDGVEVAGRVESMAAAINSAKVAVAPMQSGSGMQFKILEAMACAVPVVATKIGVGDIRAVSNVEILVGSTPQEMVDHVINLLREEGLREKLGDAGYRYVLKNHEWDRINEEFVNISGLSCGPDRLAHGMKS